MTEPASLGNMDRSGRLATRPSPSAPPADTAPSVKHAADGLELSARWHSARSHAGTAGASKPVLTADQQAFQKLLESTPPARITPNPALDGPLEPVSKGNPPPAKAIPWKGARPNPTPAERQAYRQLNENRREHFAQELKRDPVVSQALAPGQWAKLAPQQRKQVLERVAELQGQVFRFTPAPMHVNVKDQATAEKNGSYGAYDDEKGSGNGTIQLEKWALDQKEAKEGLDTVIHEQFHAMQHQKDRDAHLGHLPKSHPLFKHTELWRYDVHHYAVAPDGKDPGHKKQQAYCEGPQEKFAWEAAGDVLFKLGYPRAKIDTCL